MGRVAKKYCETCGLEMRNVHSERRFCSDCMTERKRVQKREADRKYRQKNRASTAARPFLSIAEVARRAREAKVSYGQSVVMGLDKAKEAERT